jgi:hypothetical protein
MIQSVQRELFILIEKLFAELSARLDLLPDGKPRPKDFKFASEKRDHEPVIDLPNPLRLARSVN